MTFAKSDWFTVHFLAEPMPIIFMNIVKSEVSENTIFQKVYFLFLFFQIMSILC